MCMRSMVQRFVRRFLRAEEGAVLVYTTLTLSLLVGVGVLAIDVGRATTLHTQLQNAADAAALAGARELDMVPNSIKRARAAVADALQNIEDFSDNDSRAIAVSNTDCTSDADTNCIRFLHGIPADDTTPVDSSWESSNPEEVRFIEVRLAPRSFTAWFASVVDADEDLSLGARAIAGNDSLVCSVPPMFMCNPSEPAGNTNPNYPVDMAALEGKQIMSFLQGGGGQYTPGNFGLLCPSGTEGQTNCGAGDISKNLASKFGTCVRRTSMTTKTGVTLQMVRTGINARFDWWNSQAKDENGSWRYQDAYAPAVNVTQGRAPQGSPTSGGAKCDRTELDPSQATKLGRDSCHENGDCSVRVGDGDWDYAEYFRINHGGDGSTSFRPVGWPAGAAPTRYNVYRYEIEKNQIVQPGQTIQNPDGTTTTTTEDGDPTCFQGTPPENDYEYFPDMTRDLRLLNDRRILPVAMANCNALGNPSGKFSFSPSEFIFLFMTEPMEDPSTSALFLEILGPLDGKAQKKLLHDVVQIYRR